jgi:hypothetical protein
MSNNFNHVFIYTYGIQFNLIMRAKNKIKKEVADDGTGYKL